MGVQTNEIGVKNRGLDSDIHQLLLCIKNENYKENQNPSRSMEIKYNINSIINKLNSVYNKI